MGAWRYEIQHSKINFISPRAHVLFTINVMYCNAF